MAFGNIVDYESGPVPGSYAFTKNDGQKMLFSGPAAEDLKSKLDAANKLQPQKTASLGDYLGQDLVDTASGAVAGGQRPAPPRNAADVGPNMSSMPPSGNMSPNPNVLPVGGMSEEPGMSVMPQRNASPNPGAPPPPPPVDPMAGFKALPDGGIVGADGREYDYHPPTAGSKGGLVERSRTVTDSFDPNQQYVDDKNANFDKQQEANAKASEAAIAQAHAEHTYLTNQAILQANREAEAQDQKRQIDTGVAKLQATRDAAVKDYAGSKVDPKRALAGGKNWIAALAASLGAYGAAMSKTPNFALDIIQSRIADDIDAQKAEIAVKGENANNALADLTRKLGSQQLAENALKDIQAEQAKTALQLQANGTKDQELAARQMGIAAGIENAQLDFKEQYRRDALGHVTKSLINVPATSGSKGGLVPISVDKTIARNKARAELANTQADTAAKVGKANGQGGAGLSADQQNQLNDIDTGLAGLANLEKTDKGGWVINTGFGGSDTSQSLGSQIESLSPIVGRGLEGNAPNQTTMDNFIDGLKSMSGDKRKAAIEAYRSQLINKRNSLVK